MNPGKVYSRENLLNIVWGYEYPGDARTVDVHIRRLREKIETNPSDPKYVYTKWELVIISGVKKYTKKEYIQEHEIQDHYAGSTGRNRSGSDHAGRVPEQL